MLNSKHVDIVEAQFDTVEPDCSIALIGKRRSGKTKWAQYMLPQLKNKCGRFVVMTGNKDNAQEWREMIHPLYVVDMDLEYLKKLRDFQDKKAEEFGLGQMPDRYKITIVFDDCGSSPSFMHSKIMRDLLSNGRHYGMTIIILAQYLMQMHIENRGNLDYVGVLFTNNIKDIKKIADEYVSCCDLRLFKYILTSLTKNRGLCWIDNTKQAMDISDCIFHKKMVWPFKMKRLGREEANRYADKRFYSVHGSSSSRRKSRGAAPGSRTREEKLATSPCSTNRERRRSTNDNRLYDDDDDDDDSRGTSKNRRTDEYCSDQETFRVMHEQRRGGGFVPEGADYSEQEEEEDDRQPSSYFEEDVSTIILNQEDLNRDTSFQDNKGAVVVRRMFDKIKND